MTLNPKQVDQSELLLFFRNIEEIFSKQCKNLCVIYSSDSAELFLPQDKNLDLFRGNETMYIAFSSNKSEYPRKNTYCLFTEEGSLYIEFEKLIESSKYFRSKGSIGVFEAAQKFQDFEQLCFSANLNNYYILEKTLKGLNLGHENMLLMNQVKNRWSNTPTVQ